MRNCSSRSLVNLRGEDSGISNAVPPAPYQITLPFLRASRRTNPPGIVRSRFSRSRSFFANLYSVLYISCCIPIRKTYLPLKTDWCKKGRENLCPVSPHSIFARSRHLFLFPKKQPFSRADLRAPIYARPNTIIFAAYVPSQKIIFYFPSKY